MFDLILVRYGEVALKGRFTRKRFEDKLIRNIDYALRLEGIRFSLGRERGRVFVYTKSIEKGIDVLRKIFGIVSISPATEVLADMDAMKERALEMMRIRGRDINSFAIRVSRTGSHDFTSQDVAVEVGEKVKKDLGLQVDLEEPDLELHIEVRGERAFLFFEKIKGPGGLPMGTQGRVASIIRNELDLLALWYMLKRGCSARIVSFIPREKLDRFLREWYAGIEVEVVDELDRCMDGAMAIVTGERMENLDLDMERRFDLPVLRPLIHLPDEEVERKMEEIVV